jgi:hypothetical protein
MTSHTAAWTVAALFGVIAVAAAALQPAAHAVHAQPAAESAEPTKLAVLWTSGDPDVAHRVGLMYTHATRSFEWWDETRLIVWGPSARLLAADKDLQDKIRQMMDDGVMVQACIVCADSYGVTDDLRAMDIEVKPMGAPLTRLLKASEWEVLTF